MPPRVPGSRGCDRQACCAMAWRYQRGKLSRQQKGRSDIWQAQHDTRWQTISLDTIPRFAPAPVVVCGIGTVPAESPSMANGMATTKIALSKRRARSRKFIISLSLRFYVLIIQNNFMGKTESKSCVKLLGALCTAFATFGFTARINCCNKCMKSARIASRIKLHLFSIFSPYQK